VLAQPLFPLGQRVASNGEGEMQRAVTVKGGEYFFVPGINGLEFLAAAAASGAA